ncbi:MAG: hypothetical protein NVS4B3_22500 [Gemmatimonadaceae bacterium]
MFLPFRLSHILVTSRLFLSDQLRETFTGPTWHGPSLSDLLGDVSAHEARARPNAGMHSIAEIVAHLAAWPEIAVQRLAGDAREETNAQDWPEADASTEARWRENVRRLRSRYEEIATAVSVLPDTQLDATLPGRTHSAAAMLHGLVAHGAYHGGQIALLKKMIRTDGR